MYRIPQHREQIYLFYQLSFSSDGLPVKNIDGREVFHPILPAYLIVDFVNEYRKSKEKRWLIDAVKIADLSIKQAQDKKDSLVFMYYPDSGLSLMPHEFYSALTQVWWIRSLVELSEYESKYDKTILKLFNSLLIPIDKGGILLKKSFGWIVEEYPHSPPLYTLNGWLTVIRNLFKSKKKLLSLTPLVSTFIEKNLLALKRLLPLYDAKFCLNSRYNLTGFTRLRIILNKPISYKVQSFNILIPGEEIIEGKIDKKICSRWIPFLEKEEKRVLQFNIINSLISYPQENEIHLCITLPSDVHANVYVADGDYRPDLSAMPTERWINVAKIQLTNGINKIKIPFTEKNMFAYPTNFKKKIDDLSYNTYHFIHIINLLDIYKYTGDVFFKKYGEIFHKYYRNWDLSIVNGSEKYSLHHFQYKENLTDYLVKQYNIEQSS